MTSDDFDDYDESDFDDAEPLEDVGPCCSCGGLENVRNFIMLDYEAPVKGTGWGCVVCNLPLDGATAVICDGCLEKAWAPNGQLGAEDTLHYVIEGRAEEKRRLPIEQLEKIPFGHDLKYHEEYEERFPNLMAADISDDTDLIEASESTQPILYYDGINLTWFSDSPDGGHPKCICSVCMKPIGEEQEPIVRLFRKEQNQEARFCTECAEEKLGIQRMDYPPDFDDLPF